MKTTIHDDLLQGSDEWLAARRGILTASEMHFALTPTLKIADNDKTRAHVFELAAQRITGHVEPHFVSEHMSRGKDDERRAVKLYSQTRQLVQSIGFVESEFDDGFRIGYSPDGFVGGDGLIECKSRLQKYQIQTIASGGAMPQEFALQVQTGLLVTGREWCDFVSYSGGLPMVVTRVFPDYDMHQRILAAAYEFEQKVCTVIDAYHATIAANDWPMTERAIEEDIAV
jgi:predicted phage-related endonuclease